jgi:hypothetical protein
MPSDEQEILRYRELPQELVKLERDLNGGGEGTLALDGPRSLENLIVKDNNLSEK